MLLRNLISGNRILRAPEDDAGFDQEDRHDGQDQNDEGPLDEEDDESPAPTQSQSQSQSSTTPV